jgi:hypothetical protein
MFGYNRWESVRELISLLGRLDVLHLENLRRLTFVKGNQMLDDSNLTVKKIISVYSCCGEFSSVKTKYKSEMYWSISKIKAMMYVSFKKEISSSVDNNS